MIVLPETNMFAAEKGWLQDKPFLLGPGLFSELLLLVSRRVAYRSETADVSSTLQRIQTLLTENFAMGRKVSKPCRTDPQHGMNPGEQQHEHVTR